LEKGCNDIDLLVSLRQAGHLISLNAVRVREELGCILYVFVAE
jgi:hypothetical protein